MAKKVWSFTLENQKHVVELEHGKISGKRVITLDGETIHKSKKLVDSGSEHSFQIENRPCLIRIKTNGITFSYEFVLDGYLIEPGQELHLPDNLASAGLPLAENPEKKPEHLVLIDKLNKGVVSWGGFSIALGVIHLISAGWLDASWGILLILIGLSSFLFRSASMYVVYANLLAWAGIHNLLSGNVRWVTFSIIQFVAVFQVMSQYFQFRKAGLVKNDELEEQGLLHSSRAENLFPWASALLGGLALLSFLVLVGGVFIYSFLNPTQNEIPYLAFFDSVLNLAVSIGVLALGLGLAAILSKYDNRILSILGSLAGAAVIVLNLLILLFL